MIIFLVVSKDRTWSGLVYATELIKIKWCIYILYIGRSSHGSKC
jgi:hypothetical protein